MKTLAELKRDAKGRKIEARMIVRCGGTDIPDHLTGWRKIVGCNSTSLLVLRNDGKVSELALKRASLVEYDGKSLTTFYAGSRELNAEERRVMDGWIAITQTEQYREMAYSDAYTDGSSTYYKELAYFRNAGYEYLMGLKSERGMKYDLQKHLIIDENVKGDVEMKYEIREVA